MRLRWEVRNESRVDEPTDREYETGAPWPTPAYHVVIGDAAGYRIEVELVRDERSGAPVVVGLSIRKLRGLERSGGTDPWKQRGPFLLRRKKANGNGTNLYAEPVRRLSLRDLRRLPLATLLEQARVLAGSWWATMNEASDGEKSWPPEDLPRRLARARAPRSRPRGRTGGFYEQLAAAYKAEVARGEPNPGAALARRMNESPETMRVWVYRARKLGLLPPAER